MHDFLADLNLSCEHDVPLAPRTWYGVGGAARTLVRPSSDQQLSALAARCRNQNVRVYVLGRGANLLVQDQGVDGVVVSLSDPQFRQLSIDGDTVTVGAGYDLARLVLEMAKAGLGGLEGLAGIPATVGGAIRMNAGGTYGEIGPAVRRVRVMDATGQVYYRDRDDLVFSYRKSNIVAKFILGVELDLTADDPDLLMKRVKEIFLYKKNTQPLAEHSAGCAFKNPPPPPEGPGGSAGHYIEKAGLKGYRRGGAAVSKLHANFITTDEGAKAADVLAVMEHIQQVVAEKFDVRLEREVVVWP